eukprot:1158147-Pelagomonas_calceolata.AAC.4
MGIGAWAGGNDKPNMHRKDRDAFRRVLCYDSMAAWGQGHVQNTCFHCYRTCMAELAASAVCHPQTQAELLAQANSTCSGGTP